MVNPQLNINGGWRSTGKKPTRDGYGDALLELGKTRSDIVVVTADLAESTRTDPFGKTYPDRFFDIGVAEQNLMSIGGGLAAAGLTPFISSYAMFSPGRNWEQLRNTVGYSGLNVKIASSHAGLSVGADGATHQALEDIALTRVIPNLTVISPCDYHQARLATFAAGDLRGPVYLRLSRYGSHQITSSSTPFIPGKAQILRYGDAVTLVSTGTMVAEALIAAEEINAEVINIHTIKPLDIEPIIQSITKTKKLIIVEEHQVAGGLGSAVLESLIMNHISIPLTKLMGVDDQFGQSGSADDLLHAYGLTWEHIIETYRSF